MDSIVTSLNESTSMSISLKGSDLVIYHLPQDLCRRQMMILVKNSRGLEVFRENNLWHRGLTVSLKELSNGSYSLNIFFQHAGSQYWAFFPQHQPRFIKRNGQCMFTSPPFVISNSLKSHSWSTSRDFLQRQLLPDKRFQSDHTLIRQCAHTISQGHLFPYTKVKAVHDFVASNIAYDTDSLVMQRYQHQDNSALTTLQLGRSICQGYTNLSIALLRALGIPAMEVKCYALGSDTDGGWEKPQNKNATQANHVMTAAFINHRWLLMDITWDSDLEYKGGKMREKTGCGLSNRYFDMTTTMLSFTHKLM